MKILRNIIIFLLIIVILLIGGFLFFLKTLDLNKYRKQIVEQISLNTGREVNIDSLSFDIQFTKGFTLNIKGFSVAEDKRSPEKILLSIENVLFSLEIPAFISRREIVISQIQLDKPFLKLQRRNFKP